MVVLVCGQLDVIAITDARDDLFSATGDRAFWEVALPTSESRHFPD